MSVVEDVRACAHKAISASVLVAFGISSIVKSVNVDFAAMPTSIFLNDDDDDDDDDYFYLLRK